MATLNINLTNVQPTLVNQTNIKSINGVTLLGSGDLVVTGGGAVDSVNSQTGVVVLDTDDISDAGAINKYVTDAQLTVIGNTSGTNSGDNATNSQYSGLDAAKVDKVAGKSLIDDTEISRLASMTAIFTAALKALYDAASSWVVTNGTNVLNHLSNTSNPHSVTATQVGLGNVDNTSDVNKPVSTAQQTALDLKVDENAAIVGATKTKITYDAQGLITSGADATTVDIADSSNKRYVTDAQLTVIGNTSGTNSGDNATNTQYSGLAADINALKPVTITFIIDGGGSAITTGIKGDLEIPFACTINQVTMLADQSGSVVVDIWKDTYANYPPTVADTITAAAKPTITAATKSQNATLTGWTTSVVAGDTLRFNVDSAATITRVTISLKVTRA